MASFSSRTGMNSCWSRRCSTKVSGSSVPAWTATSCSSSVLWGVKFMAVGQGSEAKASVTYAERLRAEAFRVASPSGPAGAWARSGSASFSGFPALGMCPEAGIEPVRHRLVGLDVVVVDAWIFRRSRSRQRKAEGAKGRIVQCAAGQRGKQEARRDVEAHPADQVPGLLCIQSVQYVDAQGQRAGLGGRAVVGEVQWGVMQHLTGQFMGGGIECAHAVRLDLQQAGLQVVAPVHASGLARHANQAGACQAVVQELTVAIEQGPPETGPRQREAEQCKAEAQRGLPEGGAAAVQVDQPDTPGFHGQGLPAAHPERAEVGEQHADQIQLKDIMPPAGLGIADQIEKGKLADEQACGHQQQLVDHRGDARQKRGRNGGYCGVLHGGSILRLRCDTMPQRAAYKSKPRS